MWRFEDDFEWHRFNLWGRRQNSFVLIVNDSIPSCESVDGGADVPRQNSPGCEQCRAQQVLSQRVATHKTVQSVTRVVGMKLDDPVKVACAKFVFEDFNLRLYRGPP